MPRNSLILVLILLLGISFNSFAGKKMDCTDLEATANNLEDLADAFYAASSIIREDDPVDIALGDVVDSLQVIAEMEEEGDLSRYVNNLERAWADMNSDQFSGALEDVIASFDRLLQRDCY
jgi:hypothetical protein